MKKVLSVFIRTRKISVAVFTTYLIILIILQNKIFTMMFHNPKFPVLTSTDGNLKTILIWNSAHRVETAAFGTGHEAFIKNKCEFKDCIIFTNRTVLNLEDYDAIIIHMHEIGVTSRMPEFQRKTHQRMIFFTQESPVNMMALTPSDFNEVFNWTMTYKRNSDIPLLYGRVTPKSSAPKTEHELKQLIRKMHDLTKFNYAKNKTKLVAWMVSRCESESLRENYVQELKKYVNVDVYGSCGNLSCPRDANNWLSYPICYDMLESQYKFYLSFENSICNDYVTEKFFNILDHSILPIVYGGADYSKIAPNFSYINALDYSPKELADLINSLDANDTLYNEYFWWKEHFTVETGIVQMVKHGFCNLCKKLHLDNSYKVYHNIVSEWHMDYQCI